MLRLLALPLLLVAVQSYESTIRPLPAPLKASLQPESWRPGCPVPLSDLRLLTVTHWGFDGRVKQGRLVVHKDAAASLGKVFRRLYQLRFPIRHMQLDDMYGPKRARPAGGDVTGSFRCRQSVPSPCVGGSASGRWSNHAYGLAIDINPVENPYVGCGRTRDRASARYIDRSRLRKGMVTPAVVRAFRSIGWGWGGDWTGRTKDYMHFSVNGR
ncbi:MAG TPA: M15 family metallopeptidase [Gaiellaceae bacterium]|nr:M15 family metallopeptidase [Gaiellaceae bacterium]